MVTDVSTTITQTKQKLYDMLTPSGWAEKLRLFLRGQEFTDLLELLYTDSREGRKFTPELKYVFRAFIECPFNDLKVVVIGQDPYPHMGVADGLAFSCSRTGKQQPSMQYLFRAVKDAVYPHVPSVDDSQMDPDLKRWANQGVLLLNSALTCEIGKVGSHYDRWKDFIIYVIDVINFTSPGTIFVLLGKKAQEFESLIMPQNIVLTASHPASAAYQKAKTWDCGTLFWDIDKAVAKQKKKGIIW